MDMTLSTAPKSDQINADDLISGPVTVTIREVTEGAGEQPFDFHLIEYPGRAYRPSKTMRRLIIKAWGGLTENYHGKRLTLYCNPETMFGRDKVGGIEISHMSHIDKPFSIALTKTRSKRALHKVDILATAAPTPARDWLAEMEATTDIGALTGLYKEMVATPGAGTEALKDAFGTRGAAIKAGETIEDDAA